MKIGIIGHGFVGKAVHNSLKDDVEVLVVDPAEYDTTISEMNKWVPDAVFICVPTPAMPGGEVDGSIVRGVLEDLDPGILKIVKSTITPQWLEGYEHVVFNPEFLTQRTANHDYLYPDFLIFGADDKQDARNAFTIIKNHSDVEIPVALHLTDIRSACMVKYTLNCHYAAKVIFMNEIHELHKTIGCGTTWRQFKEMLASDSRLGPSHLDVPGPDGFYGYGGACFPKDTNALKAYANAYDVNLTVLATAMNKNDLIRDETE